MPAFDLSETTQRIGRFDVIGQHAPGLVGFVGHVGLYDGDGREVGHDEEVDVVQMGPPLERPGRMNAHTVGMIPLTNEEIELIDSWVAEVEDEYRHASVYRWRQYCIRPPWEDRRDPNTGVRRYRRYSCAGFALYAYGKVDIHLLETDEQALPEVAAETLHSVFPQVRDLTPHTREHWGLEGDGPWPVVLPGYVLRALNRSHDEIRQQPYQAQAGDEFFSTRSP